MNHQKTKRCFVSQVDTVSSSLSWKEKNVCCALMMRRFEHHSPGMTAAFSPGGPGEADQPEEAVVRADGSRPEGQVQSSGSAAGRVAGGRV